MPFPESFLQELADRNDITNVVSSYVRLTKKTGGNTFGLCPFHSEKTPSFSVRPDKQMFYCFGCGKGGSVINFIMEIENLSYSDAVHFLARRAGMRVPEDKPDVNRQRRERMFALCLEAARHFRRNLAADNASNKAVDYILKRGISPATVKSFGLGYAKDSWDDLATAMKAIGFSEFELIDAGLAKSKDGNRAYDTFRDRLVFPVIDVRGNVIGFSGRLLGDGEPKYLNSPETLIFSKSRNLFALNLAKKSKCGYIILTEGNIDVAALHQAGFDSAVASLGTSLTQDQARLLSRFTSQVVIAYDSDEAGTKAAQRAISILERLSVSVRVLKMSGAKDPDEFIRQFGSDAFRNLLESSEHHVEYRLAAAAEKYDITQNDEKVAYIHDAVEILSQVHGSVEREVYAMRVADIAGVSKDVLTSEIDRLRRVNKAKAKKTAEREAMRPARAIQPAGRELAYENIRSAAAEEGLIRLLYRDPGLLRENMPEADEFTSELLGKIYAELKRRITDGDAISSAVFSGILTGDEMSHLTRVLDKPETAQNASRALDDYIEVIRSERKGHDLREIAERYREKKGYGNNDRL